MAVRLKDDVEYFLVADGDGLGLVTDKRYSQLVLGAFHLHGEVAVEIGLCSRDDTVVGINLSDICHHNRTHGVADST